MNNFNNLPVEAEIDLKKIFSTLWAGKFLIIICTSLAIFLASQYLRETEKKYTVTYKLNPVKEKATSSSISRYSGLASLAGIELPNVSGDDFQIFKELLVSVEVAEKVFENKDLIRKLFATEWNAELNEFAEEKKNQRSEFITSLKKLLTGNYNTIYMPPNPRRLVDYISTKIQILQSKNTGILKLTTETSKPETMMALILAITHASDEIMRDRYKKFSEEPLIFYKQKLSSARSREHRDALAQLIAKEEQKLMLASSSRYFVAEPLIRPYVSLFPTSPKPKLILLLFSLVGLVTAIFIIAMIKILKEK